MNVNEAIILARKHVSANASNEPSARLCLADAVRMQEAGNLDAARMWAVKSLMYSVGLFHKDCQRAV